MPSRRHLDAILALSMIDVTAIRQRRFHVALDCVRGAGATAMPPLLERLGCRVSGINLEPDGRFPRAPEPVPENLGELGAAGARSGAGHRSGGRSRRGSAGAGGRNRAGDRRGLHAGLRGPGSVGWTQHVTAKAYPTVVVNLSTSLVVEDAARAAGARVVRAPVGEANVARAIRDRGAVIGGEGNGGVMFPALHIGRDAPLGVALILHLLATTGVTLSALVAASPRYTIVKAKGPRGQELRPLYDRLQAVVSRMPSRTSATGSGSPGRIAGCTSGRPAPSRSFD